MTEIKQEIIKAIKSDIEQKKGDTEEKKESKSETILVEPLKPTNKVEPRSDKKSSHSVSVSTNEDGDKIMKIEQKKQKNKKREKKAAKEEESPTKRVRFDMSKNKVTEFFKHGKVATRVIATK